MSDDLKQPELVAAGDAEPRLPLPKNIKLVGSYHLKDKKDKDVISFMVGPTVEGIIIQKLHGKTNRFVVLVKLYDQKEVLNDQPKEEATKPQADIK